jgi:hypothetical protein
MGLAALLALAIRNSQKALTMVVSGTMRPVCIISWMAMSNSGDGFVVWKTRGLLARGGSDAPSAMTVVI